MSSHAPLSERSMSLPEEDIHTVLSNKRRRLVFKVLQDGPGATDARALSERIAEIETGESPAPRGVRHNVYVSLQQHHLPMLDRLGVIEYDEHQKTVCLGETADSVNVYFEVVPPRAITFGEYYVLVGVLGMVTATAMALGVPGMGAIEGWVLALALSVALFVSAGYQVWEQGGALADRFSG